MVSWKKIVLWVVVAALILSIAVCQKKVQKERTAGAPKATEISSVPEAAEETTEADLEKKPVEMKDAETEKPTEEPAPAEEKPMEAAKVPEKPESPEAAPAESAKPIARGNAAAIIEMEKGGRIVIEFYPEDAPNTVDNFIKLTNKGFYNGLIFHRVIKGFMAQGGRPAGRPTPPIKAELNSRKHLEGTVAMARVPGNYDSASSQFYICFGPQPSLDNEYTIFGQVKQGMDVVHTIEQGDVMKKVTIVDKASVKK